MSLDARRTAFEFFAAVTPATAPVIAERISVLMASGRRMTMVQRWLDRPTTPMEVHAGLTVDTEAMVPGIRVFDGEGHQGYGVEVLLTPGIKSLGVRAYDGDPSDEPALAAQFHARHEVSPRDLTWVAITGFGKGGEDRIVITRYNEYGVGRETTVAFDQVRTHERCTDQVATLTELAQVLTEHGDRLPGATSSPDGGALTASGLRVLAEKVAALREPLAPSCEYLVSAD